MFVETTAVSALLKGVTNHSADVSGAKGLETRINSEDPVSQRSVFQLLDRKFDPFANFPSCHRV
jgi:hypothetical protein